MRLLILLSIISFSTFGQERSTSENPNGHINPDGSFYGAFTTGLAPLKYNIYIYLSISPLMPDSMIVSDKDLFMSITGWNLIRYDIQTYKMKQHPCNAYKCIDLQIINRGRKTNYTFEEFRKILISAAMEEYALQYQTRLKELEDDNKRLTIELSNYAYQIDLAKRDRDRAESLFEGAKIQIIELQKGVETLKSENRKAKDILQVVSDYYIKGEFRYKILEFLSK